MNNIRNILKFNNLIKGKSFLAVYINQSNDQSLYYISRATQHKGNTSYEHMIINSSEDFLTFMQENKVHPVAFCYSFSGILVKKCSEITGSKEDGELIKELLPGTNSQAFTLYRIPLLDKTIKVLLVRYELIQKLVEQNRLNQDFAVSLIPVHVLFNELLEMVDVNTSYDIISTETFRITYEEGQLREFETLQGIAIGKDEIENGKQGVGNHYENHLFTQLICKQFFQPNWQENLDYFNLRQGVANYFYNRLLKIVGWSSLILIFIILIINTFVFNHYSQVTESLHQKSASELKVINEIESLKLTITREESFLKESGLQRVIHISRYADMLAESVPTDIVLTQMWLLPLQKKMQDDKQVFWEQKITIHGETRTYESLTEWLISLSGKPGIKDTRIMNYKYDPSCKLGIFKVQINI